MLNVIECYDYDNKYKVEKGADIQEYLNFI